MTSSSASSRASSLYGQPSGVAANNRPRRHEDHHHVWSAKGSVVFDFLSARKVDEERKFRWEIPESRSEFKLFLEHPEGRLPAPPSQVTKMGLTDL